MAITQKSFADYVKDLMSVLPTVNDNPMLSITSQTDADKYRENPFYMQEAIRKRIAEEEAAKAAQSQSGMLGAVPSSGGSGEGTPALSKEQNQFFDWMESTPEGKAFKDERGTAMGHVLGMLAPGAGLMNIGKTLTGQPPSLTSLVSTPQSFYNWQAAQQQSDPKYIADSIARVKAESDRWVAENTAYSAPGYTGGGGDSVNYTPDTYTGADVSYGDTSWGTLF